MKYIYKCGRLKEEETRKYVKQLVSAVDHLHKAGLIHRLASKSCLLIYAQQKIIINKCKLIASLYIPL